MRIRFLANTNIRISPTDLSRPPVGVIYSGVELEVEDRLYKGRPLDGVDTYFRDSHGWFYWSGRVVILYKALEGPKVRKKAPEPEGENVGGSWQFSIEQPGEEPEPGSGEKDTQPAPGQWPGGPRETKPDNRDEAPKTAKAPPAPPVWEAGAGIASMPLNWGLEALGIPEFFWKEKKLAGRGIKVALLGTGVEQGHPGLSGKIVKGENFSGGPASDFKDENGEGTAFALLIGGKGKGAVTGVAPAVQFLVGKVMANYLDIRCSQFLEALQWAIEERADIIMANIEFRESSLSRPEKNQLSRLYERAAKQGAFCIAPAGRSKNVRPENRYPAALRACLSVGAYEENGERSANSIRSYALDIVSPGGGLMSGSGQPSPEAVGAAAAFTAGSTALLMEWLRNNNRKMSPGELMKIIRDTALPKYPSIKCRDIEYGCGYFNPVKVLEQLEQGSPT